MPEDLEYTQDDLAGLIPSKEFFVGIDSDGCVFDTMEIKQKECFHPRIISHWGLEGVEKELRETAEFVSLYSKWRGSNRFIALVKVFELMKERASLAESSVTIPELPALKAFIASNLPLGNPALKAEVERTGDAELASLLQWSEDVNADIAETAKNIPPFRFAAECIKRIAAHSDAICVSQTPEEALVREWSEHDLVRYVKVIAGQELGRKSEHLDLAAGGKYPSEKVLMIGDAPGDRDAARATDALFFPINPGHEVASWELFHNEAFDRFLAGDYAGEYEQRLVDEFEALLPEIPLWDK